MPTETAVDAQGVERKLDRIYMQQHRRAQALWPATDFVTPESKITAPDDLRALERGYRHWNKPPVMDQGREGACTGFGVAALINAGPDRPKNAELLTDAEAQALYLVAKDNDEWWGNAYDGSSVNGAMIAARKAGLITAFAWLREMQTVRHVSLTYGPIDWGLDWTEDMMRPDENGVICATGPVVGGHSLAQVSWNEERVIRVRGKLEKGFVTWQQSWSKRHGKNGRVLISIEHLARLLEGLTYPGDAAIAVEVKKRQRRLALAA